MTILYRGDTSRPERPEITAGTWLTEDADVAAWYGCAHRYELDDLRVLDLTNLGVGGDFDPEEGVDPEYVEQVEQSLRDAGIDPTDLDTGAVEIYMMVESAAFIAAARDAGYDVVRSEQWHADRDDTPYIAVMAVRDL